MRKSVVPAYFYEGQLILPAEGNLGEVWLSGRHFAENNSKLQENHIKIVISAAEI